MDWFSAWEPVAYPYTELQPIEPPADAARVTAWAILALIALVTTVIWFRLRARRHSFWCAIVGRDVEVRLRSGSVLSCTAFENAAAIACTRRCVDRTFRVQWPSALPVAMPARPRLPTSAAEAVCRQPG